MIQTSLKKANDSNYCQCNPPPPPPGPVYYFYFFWRVPSRLQFLFSKLLFPIPGAEPLTASLTVVRTGPIEK